MQIVCFGDSVTRGISYAKGRLRIVKENYPAVLQGLLGASAEVINKGVFNDNSDGLASRLDTDVLSHNPDYVLIEIGGNDCNFRWDEVAVEPEREHEPIVPLTRYLENLTVMVQRIAEANVVPVVMNLLPLDPVRYYQHIAQATSPAIAHWIARCGGIEHWHGMYNRSLRGLANRLEVTTIDVRTAFKRAADLAHLLSDDGIHPTDAGYGIMARTIAQAMQPVWA